MTNSDVTLNFLYNRFLPYISKSTKFVFFLHIKGDDGIIWWKNEWYCKVRSQVALKYLSRYLNVKKISILCQQYYQIDSSRHVLSLTVFELKGWKLTMLKFSKLFYLSFDFDLFFSIWFLVKMQKKMLTKLGRNFRWSFSRLCFWFWLEFQHGLQGQLCVLIGSDFKDILCDYSFLNVLVSLLYDMVPWCYL